MVNLQKERSQTHQKCSFQDKMTPKTVWKRMSKYKHYKVGFWVWYFFKWKHIKVIPSLKTLIVHLEARIYKTKAKKTNFGQQWAISVTRRRADIWERRAVTWAVRGSERAILLKKFTSARLPGRCADIWERRADIWAARGFLGIKSHLIIETSSKFAYICQGMSAHVFYGGMMIQRRITITI